MHTLSLRGTAIAIFLAVTTVAAAADELVPPNTAAKKGAAQRHVQHRYAHRADPYRHDLAAIPYEEFPEGYPGYYSGLGGPYYPASFYRGFFYEGNYWTRAYYGTARGEYQRWYGGW